MTQLPLSPGSGVLSTDKFESQRRKFAEELPEYADREPVKCKSVGITLKFPTYSDLTPDQLNYYTYWKNTLGTPEFRKAADGYVWLLMCELLNSPDPDEVSSKLNMLVSAQASDGSPFYPELLETAVTYATLRSTPLPAYSQWMYAPDRRFMLSPLLASPVSDIPVSMLQDMTDVSGSVLKDPELPMKVGGILRGLDEKLSTMGTDLRTEFLRPVKLAYRPFPGYAVVAEPAPVERVVWEPKGLDILLSNVVSVLTGQKPDPSFRYGEELVRIFKRLTASGFVPNAADPLAKPDVLPCRRLGTPCGLFGPSRLNDPSASARSGRQITLGEILTFSGTAPKMPEPFIVSGWEHPVYKDLSKACFAYYVYWRDCFRKGRYLDTDNGYVNLFLTEIINTESPDDARRDLTRLLEVYGEGSQNLIALTLMDHTLCNRGTFTDHLAYNDRMVTNCWIDTFLHGDTSLVLDRDMLDRMRSGSYGVTYMESSLPLGPFGEALQRIFAEVERKKGIRATLNPRPVSAVRSVYVSLDYFRGRREVKVEFDDYVGCRKLNTFIDKAVKFASAYAKNGNGPAFSFAGMKCCDIIAECIDKEKVSRPKEEHIRLDPEAVAAAESDLRTVTELMRIEEEPEEAETVPAKAEVTETPAPRGPWESLFASLTGCEKEYLKIICAGGDAQSFLLSHSLTRISAEDSINNKALDTVGDTVLEDGTVVEDYREDIEKGLE